MQLWAKQPFTQFDVDNKCRLVTCDNFLLTKTFGSGLAFPMRSNDGMMIPDQGKANPRADSFALYLNFVANQMLQNLLPKSKLDTKLQKTTRGGDKKPLTQEQPKNAYATPQKNAANPTVKQTIAQSLTVKTQKSVPLTNTTASS